MSSRAQEKITIIGGGLAGLTLGIGLRRHNVPVTVWEAGKYPRHRVCGEFISGNGLRVLGQLGLADELRRVGARQADTSAFFSQRSTSPAVQLPEPALCLSRFTMDELLARKFRALGGELREGARWREAFSESVVRASGRRLQPTNEGWRWLGLKVHARGVRLRADLEMHLRPNSYVGLCQLADDTVNVCGLFRSQSVIPNLAATWREVIRGEPGTPLQSRLRDAEFISDSFCAVSGFSLTRKRASESEECRIGDALTMIPPVAGNGMSMAFESAALAVEPLVSYSRGDFTWEQTRRRIATDSDLAFGRRLRWAAQLQSVLLHRGLGPMSIDVVGRCPFLFRLLFTRTR